MEASRWPTTWSARSAPGLRRSPHRDRRRRAEPARSGLSGRRRRVQVGGLGGAADHRWPAGNDRGGGGPGCRVAAGKLTAAVRRARHRCRRHARSPGAGRADGRHRRPCGTRLLANVRAMQDGGTVTATLAEVRNRADLVLWSAPTPGSIAPRLIERCLDPRRPCSARSSGNWCISGRSPAVAGAEALSCPRGAGRGAGGAAGLGGRRPDHGPDAVAGLPVASLRASPRGCAGALPGDPLGGARPAEPPGPRDRSPGRADPRPQRQGPLLRRAAGRPRQHRRRQPGLRLADRRPLRTSFASGGPDHDPVRWSAAPRSPPGPPTAWSGSAASGRRRCPIGRADRCPGAAGHTLPGAGRGRDPGGTPGLDHAGSVYRMDGVVSLPLRVLRDTGLPSVAQALARIRALLEAS